MWGNIQSTVIFSTVQVATFSSKVLGFEKLFVYLQRFLATDKNTSIKRLMK